MKYTNLQLQTYFDILNEVASKVTGKLAYLVTKNARVISNELNEYTIIRNDNIRKYGQEIDGQIKLAYDSPEYTDFCKVMAEYDNIELDVKILKAKPEDLYTSQLNAVEMDRLSFMIDEEEDA